MKRLIAESSKSTDPLQKWRDAHERTLRKVWSDDQSQDIAEYAVMLALILVLVVGTMRLIGGKANNVFSQAASAIGG